jgi:hypothetical protein
VTLEGLPEGNPETLGSVEVDDETLRDLDVLVAGHERVRVQREVDDDFFRRGRHACEVGVGGVGLLVVEDDLRSWLLRLRGLGGFCDLRETIFDRLVHGNLQCRMEHLSPLPEQTYSSAPMAADQPARRCRLRAGLPEVRGVQPIHKNPFWPLVSTFSLV